MELCPDTLDITLHKYFKDSPPFFKDRTLQLSDLFQTFIKEVGNAVAEIKREQSYFIAENGVVVEMDSDVCHMYDCMEDDGNQKVFR